MAKSGKTEQQLAQQRAFNQQKAQYDAFINRIKSETLDNEIRIKWMKSKIDLDNYAQTLQGEEEYRKLIVIQALDSLIIQFKLEDKKEEFYKFLGLTKTEDVK